MGIFSLHVHPPSASCRQAHFLIYTSSARRLKNVLSGGKMFEAGSFHASDIRITPIAIALAAGLTLAPLPAICADKAFRQAEADSSLNQPKDVADMDIEELAKVRVSPFDVSSHLDNGYRASNSVSGSRFDAPIRDLPFAIQAFTESFIKDQKPVNIFDVARYSPGVTYRSNDFTEGNANLAIRGFAVSGTAGNVQILRDGFHGPSIFDFTNISRVEVVKGPSSFLYGQVAPGGMSMITKSPSRAGATADSPAAPTASTAPRPT
jgi:iron complex outermembrane receptor protein